MGTLKVGLEVSGTIMARQGQPPLLAVSSMLDGKVVQAALIDPGMHPGSRIEELMETSVQMPGGAVGSPEQPRP